MELLDVLSLFSLVVLLVIAEIAQGERARVQAHHALNKLRARRSSGGKGE